MIDGIDFEFLITADGSHTIRNKNLDVTYHSRHGAIKESMHVFINAGLQYMMAKKNRLKIFELGFGTGLNALLTLLETERSELYVDYTGIDTNPLPVGAIEQMNYPVLLENKANDGILKNMHTIPFNEVNTISGKFNLTRINSGFEAFNSIETFDLIYYDAFAPNAQPELWTQEIFEKIKGMMNEGGCLVTYCSKSDVRRAMQAAGLTVSKLPGPPGKREMIRAENISSTI
jgi:tRNA U34 5-methylaminomethyl-2-thiouridine-forming methyltransferase MnmC